MILRLHIAILKGDKMRPSIIDSLSPRDDLHTEYDDEGGERPRGIDEHLGKSKSYSTGWETVIGTTPLP